MNRTTAMRGFFLSIVCAGCVHAEDVHPSSRTAVAPPLEEDEVAYVEAPAPVVEAPSGSRPRLSQTVTLGETASTGEIAPAPAPPAAGPTVIVNNNIVVSPGYGYGGYGGYGYGYGGGYGARTLGRGPSEARTGAPSTARTQWGASGWEGARRTAAPGQTPAVGGNWSAPASYGPSQMK